MELLTVQQVAKKLKVNKNTVYRLIKKGYITALKLGSLKVATTEVDRFIEFSIGKDFTDLDNVTELVG